MRRSRRLANRSKVDGSRQPRSSPTCVRCLLSGRMPGPRDRRVLATALFARTDGLGFERMEYELTPDAVELGLGAALPAVFEIGQDR